MPTPTITIRLPEDIRRALNDRAVREKVPLRTYIVTALTVLAHGEEVAIEQATVPVSEAMPEVSIEDMQRRGLVVVKNAPSAEQIAERDRRHISPLIAPERTVPREGFEIAESDCDHPKENRQHLDYMTRCKRCGRRIS